MCVVCSVLSNTSRPVDVMSSSYRPCSFRAGAQLHVAGMLDQLEGARRHMDGLVMAVARCRAPRLIVEPCRARCVAFEAVRNTDEARRQGRRKMRHANESGANVSTQQPRSASTAEI